MPNKVKPDAVCPQCGAAHPQEFPAKVGDLVQLSDGKTAVVTCTLPAHFTAIRYKRDPKTGHILKDKKTGERLTYTVEYRNPLPWAMVCQAGKQPEGKLISDAAYFASFPVDSSQLAG